MVTGESFCKKAFDTHGKAENYESFKAGWYGRENFTWKDNRKIAEVLSEIESKYEMIKEYIQKLYADFNIDESNKYMGHNDPLSNIICLLNQSSTAVSELADRRAGEQFELF